jgi:Zn-dependent protease with chaperone function
MYFVVILAFALVLSDELPPPQFRSFWGRPEGDPLLPILVLGVIVGQLALVAAVAWWNRRRVLARLDGTDDGHDRAADAFAQGQAIVLVILAAALVGTTVLTPWAHLVRDAKQLNLDRIPLLGDLLVLVPFFASLTLAWWVHFAAESALRHSAYECEASEGGGDTANPPAVERSAARQRPEAPPDQSLRAFLVDKFRHHVLIIGGPMTLIVLAKHFTDLSRAPLTRSTGIGWLSDAILGTVSIAVLALAPVMLRYIWKTEALAAGPLRTRFERTCRRIGLRYREILLWRTHGMAVNAAVMGFIPPLRYVMVSDALLETMEDGEIEAVFGHEAGHVHHWHLPMFGVFAVNSMCIAGGVIVGMQWMRPATDPGTLQLVGLGILMIAWLFGFGWLSRRFERQADLFAVRCIAPDVERCVEWCPVHGKRRSPGLCVSAVQLFGRTLDKIAHLNGIPTQMPTWRHGSIDARRQLLERLVAEPAQVAAFDRRLRKIKIVLIAIGVVGCLISVAYFYADTAQKVDWLPLPSFLRHALESARRAGIQ